MTRIAFSPDGKALAVLDDDRVCFWSIQGDELGDLHTGQGIVTDLAFSPDGRCLATGSKDNSIVIWDVKSHKQIRTIQWPLAGRDQGPRGIRCVAWSPNGHFLAVGSEGDSGESSLRLWNVENENKAIQFGTFRRMILSLAFSSDGGALAVVEIGHPGIVLCDPSSGKTARVLNAPCGSVNCVCFSPDGQTVVGGDTCGVIRMWDKTTGKEASRPPEHQGGVFALSFSGDSKSVASVGGNYDLHCWRVKDGMEWFSVSLQDESLVHPITGSSVSFTPDGEAIVCSAGDRLVFRDGHTGRLIRRLPIMDTEFVGFDCSFSGGAVAVQTDPYARDGPNAVVYDLDSGKKRFPARTPQRAIPISCGTRSVAQQRFVPTGSGWPHLVPSAESSS